MSMTVMPHYTCNLRINSSFLCLLLSQGLFGSSSTSTGLFGQRQSTGAFGQTGNLFGTQTLSTTSTGFGSGFGTNASTGLFGESTSKQTVCVICLLLLNKLIAGHW